MKIAILLPVHSHVTAGYAEASLNMVAHTVRAIPEAEIQCFRVSRSNISIARNELLYRAAQWGAERFLWTDADHVFPKDALVRLLAHSVPFVGCNYPRRQFPIAPSATRFVDGGIAPLEPGGTGLVEASTVGFGFLLMSGEVIAALERQSSDVWPLFKEVWNGKRISGEDAYFCGRVRDAGITILADQDLSMQIGHVAETVLTFPQT